MKKSIKIVSLILPLAILIAGIVLFMLKKKQTGFSLSDMYLPIALIAIGVISFVTCFFVFICYNPKKFEKTKRPSELEVLANKIKENLEQINSAKENEIEPKKIKCSFCKMSFDSNLDRCPSCGAPPERVE